MIPPPPPVSLAVPASADDRTAGSVDDFLAAYRWSRRVVLLLVDQPDDPELQAQQAELASHVPEIAERDIVVIVSANRDLRRRLSVPAEGFAFLLLGKDGGVKLRSATLVSFAELAAIVDAMPMRQDEMRRDPARRGNPQ